MKHNPKATANALAVTGGALYVFCAIWVVISGSSFMSVLNTWAHGIEVSALPLKTPDLGTLVIGFVTFIGAAWLTGYVFARLYNYFVR